MNLAHLKLILLLDLLTMILNSVFVTYIIKMGHYHLTTRDFNLGFTRPSLSKAIVID